MVNDTTNDRELDDANVRKDFQSKLAAQRSGAIVVPSTSSHLLSNCTIIDEKLKMKLAMQTSKVLAPGAFHDNKMEEEQAKPSAEHVRNYTKLKQAQKARGYVDREHDAPECSSMDGQDAIDDIHDNMNAFQNLANMENAKEDQHRAKECKIRRKRRILYGIIAILFIVCGCVGITVAVMASKGSGGGEEELVVAEPCYLLPINEQNARFNDLRSELTSQSPSLSTAIDMKGSTARAALCWLADLDDLQIDDDPKVLQRFVLALIYYHFVGMEVNAMTKKHPLTMSGWVGNSHVCNWGGVGCNDKDVITSINLQRMKLLRLPIPTELTMLTNLIEIILSDNRIAGQIPSEISSLTQLRMLDIHNNMLSGQLPSEIITLTNLVEVKLSYNEFTGQIPSEISSLTQLKILELHSNELSGQLPFEIFSLPQLESLIIGMNSFSGTLPEQLSNTTNLVKLEIWETKIAGTLPDLSNLTDLKNLALANNQNLKGSFPDLSRSSSLELLDLSGSFFTGSIPAYIWSFFNMTAINISGGSISGTVPTEIGRLIGLRVLRLSTRITGTIPTEIGLLSNLVEFFVHYSIEGTIPTQMCSLPNLDQRERYCSLCPCCMVCFGD